MIAKISLADGVILFILFTDDGNNEGEKTGEQKKWVTVYTDFGYGVIDGEKFLE